MRKKIKFWILNDKIDKLKNNNEIKIINQKIIIIK